MHRPPKLVRVMLLIAVVITSLFLVGSWAGPLFSGALFLLLPNPIRPILHDLPESYEPVHQGHLDISTGLYIREDEDLVLSETPAFLWRRTYLSGDRVSRQFGVGATHNGEWYLIGDPARFDWAELILADGGRIHFDRLTPGSSYPNAVFGHNATPTSFYGSLLGWVGSGWAMRLRDGSLVRFLACGPDSARACALASIRDPDGHTIFFNRDSAGVLRDITADRQRLELRYDPQGRIVKAFDGAQRAVEYSYDAAGRLVRAASNGVVRCYEYDAADHLVIVREPGREINNMYDAAGRLIHQTVHQPNVPDYVERFAYTVDGQSVVETDVTENNGTHTRYRFDKQHRVSMESYSDAANPPITVSFNRGSGEFARSLTIDCMNDGKHVIETVPITSSDEEDAKDSAIREHCQ